MSQGRKFSLNSERNFRLFTDKFTVGFRNTKAPRAGLENNPWAPSGRFCKSQIQKLKFQLNWRHQPSPCSHPCSSSTAGRGKMAGTDDTAGKQCCKEGTLLTAVIYDLPGKRGDTQPGTPWGSVPGLVLLKIFF